MRGMWRGAALVGLAWIATLGMRHIAVGADEPERAIPPSQMKSGTAFLSQATREQQDDLTVNPGMLWVERGGELWREPAAAGGKSCASCHGEPLSMRGVAARYPVWDATAGRLHNIETRIIECRSGRQQSPAPKPDSDEMLALSALVSHQSRGMPVAVSIDGPARAKFEQGRAMYTARFGQLNLSCAHCHEENWGRRLRSETVSQGHANGYPVYRLEWQTLGSLHRRLRGCFNSVRSYPPAHGSEEHLALELFLAWRANGLTVETPAIRR